MQTISSRLAAAIQGFLVLAAAMAATGTALAFLYRPSRLYAKEIFRPQIGAGPGEGSALWEFAAAAHYWGSAVSIVWAAVLLVWLFLGGLEPPRRAIWLPALAAFLLSLGSQIAGNVLPMDRHDVQTLNVEAAIAGRAPLAGEAVHRFMLAGDRFSDATAQRWHAIALGLGIAFVAACCWLYWTLRRSKPTRAGRADRLLTLIPLALAAGLALALPRATGELFGPEDATAQTAAPSWYVLPLHSLLRAFGSIRPDLGWIGALAMPGLAVVALAFAPVWSRRWAYSARLNATMGACAALALLMGLWGSPPAPLSGPQPVETSVPGSVGSAGPIDSRLAQQGEESFDQNCAGCHGRGGRGAPGAPALNSIHRRIQDPAWYMRFIRDPRSVRAGSTMPAFPGLKDEELRALAEWLRMPK